MECWLHFESGWRPLARQSRALRSGDEPGEEHVGEAASPETFGGGDDAVVEPTETGPAESRRPEGMTEQSRHRQCGSLAHAWVRQVTRTLAVVPSVVFLPRSGYSDHEMQRGRLVSTEHTRCFSSAFCARVASSCSSSDWTTASSASWSRNHCVSHTVFQSILGSSQCF